MSCSWVEALLSGGLEDEELEEMELFVLLPDIPLPDTEQDLMTTGA